MNILFVFLALLFQDLSVQGIVVRGRNEPLSKATVELRAEENSATLVSAMTTEEDGKFVFQNVNPGRYRLYVKRQGFVRPPLALTVTAAEALPDMTLLMTPAGAIYGSIHDNQGAPLGNVEVRALKA